MVETLTSAATAKLLAGTNVSTNLTSGNWTTFINQAEGEIALRTKIDWVSRYTSLSDNYRKVLEMAASALAANKAIRYDMNTYLSITEAQTLLDANDKYFEDAIKKLENFEYSDFLINGES